MTDILEKIKLATDISSGLVNTANLLSDWLAERGHPELIKDETFLSMVDDRVFLCADCGYWCDIRELTQSDDDDDVCLECSDSYGDHEW